MIRLLLIPVNTNVVERIGMRIFERDDAAGVLRNIRIQRIKNLTVKSQMSRYQRRLHYQPQNQESRTHELLPTKISKYLSLSRFQCDGRNRGHFFHAIQ